MDITRDPGLPELAAFNDASGQPLSSFAHDFTTEPARDDAAASPVTSPRNSDGPFGFGGGTAASMSITQASALCLRALREQAGHVGYTVSDLSKAAGVLPDVLASRDLLLSLQSNDKIAYDRVTETYRYQPAFPCDDAHGLLRLLRQHPEGLRIKDLEDSYPGVRKDLEVLTRTGGAPALAEAAGLGRLGAHSGPVAAAAMSASEGGLIRWRNDDREHGDVAIWRAPLVPEIGGDYHLSYFTPLSGTVTLTHGSHIARTSHDLSHELFRNDIVVIGGHAYRVSSAPIASSSTRKSAAEVRLRLRSQRQAVNGGGATGTGIGTGSGESASVGEGVGGRRAPDASMPTTHTGNSGNSSGRAGGGPRSSKRRRVEGEREIVGSVGESGRDGVEDGDGDDDNGSSEEIEEGIESDLELLDAELDFDVSEVGVGGGTHMPDTERSGNSGTNRDSSSLPSGSHDASRVSSDATTTATATATGLTTAAAETGVGKVQLYPDTGIYVVSVGNDVKRTGGAFSASDTAPHRLPLTSVGYAQAFTATQLPLDRPWDGPDCVGQVVYRIGASGDVRTLWRLMATHDASDIAAATGSVMVDSNDTAAGETKASGSSSSNNGGSRALQVGGEGILPKLGGTTGLRHLPTFPLTHQELRTQMAKAGLPTSKLTSDALQAGTTDLSAAERRKARRAYRVRKPHKASLMMDLGYLKGTAAGGAAQRAMLELALEKYAKEKSAAEGRHLEDIHKSSGAAFVVGGGGRS